MKSSSTIKPLLSTKQRFSWRTIQVIIWLAGVAIFIALLAWPQVGIDAFWNFLIPVAPALFAFAPGLWRNLCPLGSTSMATRHLGLSKKKTISVAWQRRLGLIGIVILLLIVPLRHVVLNTNGPATALVIALLALLAIIMGTHFEWKSGWCSGLCPINPVEKLYGQRPLFTVPNAHCTSCHQCVTPCQDSLKGISPFRVNKTLAASFGAILLTGGFPGYIWGWFQVPDYLVADGFSHLLLVYGYPLGGLVVSVTIFLIIMKFLPKRHEVLLVRFFAVAAISCYYWFRLPALFGFGLFPGDGMLVDLTTTLPVWFPVVSQIFTTLLFFWWFVGRKESRRGWLFRPSFATSLSR